MCYISPTNRAIATALYHIWLITCKILDDSDRALCFTIAANDAKSFDNRHQVLSLEVTEIVNTEHGNK